MWLIVWTIAEQLRILIVLQIKTGKNFYQVIIIITRNQINSDVIVNYLFRKIDGFHVRKLINIFINNFGETFSIDLLFQLFQIGFYLKFDNLLSYLDTTWKLLKLSISHVDKLTLTKIFIFTRSWLHSRSRRTNGIILQGD